MLQRDQSTSDTNYKSEEKASSYIYIFNYIFNYMYPSNSFIWLKEWKRSIEEEVNKQRISSVSTIAPCFYLR